MTFLGDPGEWKHEWQIKIYLVISTIALQNKNEKWLLNFFHPDNIVHIQV